RPAGGAGGGGGRTPPRGRVSGARAGEPLLGWAVHFVLSRTVRDTAAFLDLLSPPAPGDPAVAPPPQRPFADEVGADPGRLRVGFAYEPWSGAPVVGEVRAACEEPATALA